MIVDLTIYLFCICFIACLLALWVDKLISYIKEE